MATNGEIGYIPQWYVLIRAAKYLGVAPWVLARKSIVWSDWAAKCMAAQAHADKIHAQRSRRKK